MTRFLRTMIGALIGAVCVLLWNGVSRPYSIYLFSQVFSKPIVSKSAWITENQRVLRPPKSTLEASLWADAGAHQMRFAHKGTNDKLHNLLKALQIGEKLEPSNAFWTQMSAVVYNALGERNKAVEAWLGASRKPKWNDHQADRMLKVVSEIEAATGHRASWPLFALSAFKDDNAAQLILRFAFTVISQTGLEFKSHLNLRYATFVNGCLIRDYGSSVPIYTVGIDIMEMASYPPNMETYPSNRALVLARINLVNNLRKVGLGDQAEYIYKQYQENDARNYYIGSVDPIAAMHKNAALSLLIATIPSSLLGVSLAALFLWLIGGLMLKYPALQKVLMLPYAPIIGATLAILIYAYLKLGLLALSTVATFAFATFAPSQERTRANDDLGPFFRFSIIMIGLLLTAILGTFLISLTEAAQISNYVLLVPEEFSAGSVAMIVLALACLGLLVLIAPAWAIVRKLKTPWVFAVGLRDLGKGLFLGAALLSIVACPIAVNLDQSLYAKGKALLEKEPLYYMSTNE